MGNQVRMAMLLVVGAFGVACMGGGSSTTKGVTRDGGASGKALGGPSAGTSGAAAVGIAHAGTGASAAAGSGGHAGTPATGTSTNPDSGLTCSSADCGDTFSCTVDSCRADGCAHTIGPNTGATACPARQYCTVEKGCVAAPACANDQQCIDAWKGDACKANPRCDSQSSVCLFDLLDKDKDGHAPQVCGGDDCDDSDAAVHPGAVETCGGKDQNCDGHVDGATCRDQFADWTPMDSPATFADNGNGTVTDSRSGLVWQQALDANYYTWADAPSYCASLSLGGTGWRLPAIAELESIVDFGKYRPAIDPTAFPNTPSEYFWSSSEYLGDVWSVDFSDGNSIITPTYHLLGLMSTATASYVYRVRCVRWGVD